MIEPPPGAVVVRSDVVRKRLFGVCETTALPQQAYQADTSARVYGALYETARRILAQGVSVVIDASFMEERERAALLRLAHGQQTRFVGIFLTAAFRRGWRGSRIGKAMPRTLQRTWP
jgi:predicted kinase